MMLGLKDTVESIWWVFLPEMAGDDCHGIYFVRGYSYSLLGKRSDQYLIIIESDVQLMIIDHCEKIPRTFQERGSK
jgi:hypothetical protein